VETEGDVPSPLDFAAFFSEIANYDYAPLGHQVGPRARQSHPPAS
jgi:hypothetical protein